MSVTEQNRPISSDEDDVVFTLTLADILAFLKRSRRAMLVGALIGGLLGALYAFNKPNEYTSQVTLLPEIQAKSGGTMGGLSSLAGLAGIDINGLSGNADAVRPELYPTVLQSVPFALAIAKQPVYSKEFKKTQSLEAYLEAKNEPNWFSRLFAGSTDSTSATGFGPNTGALRLTKQQDELTKIILARVLGTYDKKSGVLTISTTMPDPIVAASTTQQTLAYLTDYVTGYRTEKARMEVDFLTKQVAAAKQRYQQAEYALSAYRDQNRSVYLNTAKIEEQRIQAEFLLAQDLYNALSKQSEMAKIKVQQDTPVFKILEPAQIPLKKSAPKRTIIVLVSVIAGMAISLLYSFFRRD
ncbi:lipopolysaccharide biosynthesis protein [Fibrella sp. HMF5335]|uniref:Lipopolysaccharide biosynthesis protein n=1 Tax=Fibrella rubiginis TaxID=2817060 RepID=A0A939GIP2_9BACT|nr:GNVR domain-containing protein [Fibrella rubiginis]MBO0937949.1 lipopolysaccharide biosynthesis protein [Fibrella rubiginis]